MQIEINFIQQEVKNSITYQKAKDFSKIVEKQKIVDALIERARYLAGGKRGAWKRTTMADEKRSFQISKKLDELRTLKKEYNEKHNEHLNLFTTHLC